MIYCDTQYQITKSVVSVTQIKNSTGIFSVPETLRNKEYWEPRTFLDFLASFAKLSWMNVKGRVIITKVIQKST